MGGTAMAKDTASGERAEAGDESDQELDRAVDELRGITEKAGDGDVHPTGELETEFSAMAKKKTAEALDNDFGADFADTGEPGITPQFSGVETSTDLDAMFATAEAGDDLDDEPAAALMPPSASAASLADHIPENGLEAAARRDEAPNFDLVMDIPLDMQIVLGTSRLPVSGLMNLSEGALIALNRKIGEPVEIMVNGRLFGRGEITVLEEDDTRFGVRVIEVIGDIKQ